MLFNKLDYIKGMGFDIIWIFPIIENKEGSYHGYLFTNLFGGETGFKQLVSECNNKDIWVMIDIVPNHTGQVGTDFDGITSFNKVRSLLWML